MLQQVPIGGPDGAFLKTVIIRVQLANAQTATKGHVVTFVIDTNGNAVGLTNTADGAGRCHGVALEDGAGGAEIDVCIGGKCDMLIEGKNSAGTGSQVAQLDYVYTSNASGTGNYGTVGRKAVAGDKLLAQVIYGPTSIASGDPAEWREVIVLNSVGFVAAP